MPGAMLWDTPPYIPELTGKPLRKSTTALAATTSGIAALASSAREINSILQGGNFTLNWSMVVLVLGVLGIVGAFWIIKERKRHARDFGA